MDLPMCFLFGCVMVDILYGGATWGIEAWFSGLLGFQGVDFRGGEGELRVCLHFDHDNEEVT